MKITLPNGVVIESDEAITVGDLTVTPISTVITEVDPVKHDQFFERLILEDGRPSPQELALGKIQRETLTFVRELGEPVAPSYVAEYFDITSTSWLEVWFSSKSGHLVYIVKADIVSEYKGQGQWTSRVPDIDEVEVLDEVWDEIERSDRRYAIAYALFLLLEPSRSDDDLNKIRRDYWDAEIKKAEDRLQRVKALSQGA